MPFYIFCESYGGKMVAAFGTLLHKVMVMFVVYWQSSTIFVVDIVIGGCYVD